MNDFDNFTNDESDVSKQWYRKYRPSTLEEYSNDGSITKIVNKRFTSKENRPHVVMVQGERGCGKTTLCRMLLPYYQCQSPKEDGTPCGECETCRTIRETLISGETEVEIEDVVEVNGSSLNGKEAIGQLMEEAMQKPVYSQYKIVIIDECQKVTVPAQNLMLKYLEDTPEHLVVMLATTDPQDIIVPLLSRVNLKIEVHRQSVDSMVQVLKSISEKEKLTVSEEALEYIAKKRKRVPRECITLLEEVAKTYDREVLIDNVREYTKADVGKMYYQYLTAANESLAKVSLFVYGLQEKSIQYNQFLNGLIRYVLDCMYIKHGIGLSDFDPDQIEEAKELFDEYTVNEFDVLLQTLEYAATRMKSGSEDDASELLLLTTAMRISKIDLLASGLCNENEQAREENKGALKQYHDKIIGDEYTGQGAVREVVVEQFKKAFTGTSVVSNAENVVDSIRKNDSSNNHEQALGENEMSAEELEEYLYGNK